MCSGICSCINEVVYQNINVDPQQVPAGIMGTFGTCKQSMQRLHINVIRLNATTSLKISAVSAIQFQSKKQLMTVSSLRRKPTVSGTCTLHHLSKIPLYQTQQRQANSTSRRNHQHPDQARPAPTTRDCRAAHKHDLHPPAQAGLHTSTTKHDLHPDQARPAPTRSEAKATAKQTGKKASATTTTAAN
eukprot:TRINITY_DN8025_c0_g1_i5.p2 TRINITY_DN8025_c0_g1~~TRINITY_DN8025_c0_g1_i5.p2  ORF type:complete len:188 (-),score=24.11 TRINITY_DN8025_c0_g1_i5:894-1457(-)